MIGCYEVPKISVIIPTYNREKTISACLCSILMQSFENLEIICVDDGSVDGSLKIIEDFAKSDHRIVVLCQKNCGASCARNSGLAAARGEFVNFVDSDDWIDVDTYEIVYQKAKEFDVDIVCWGRMTKEKYLGPSNEVVLRGIDSVEFLIPKSIHHERHSVCTKLYKMTMLKQNEILFDVLVHHGEDILFNMDVIPFTHGILCVNRSFYHYCLSNTGVSLGHGEKDVQILANRIVEHLNEMRRTFGLSEKNVKDIQSFANLMKRKGEKIEKKKKKRKRIRKRVCEYKMEVFEEE